MTISIDWANKLVLSDDSIPEIVAFKDTLRAFEDDDDGVLHPPIITYKKLDIGGGAYLHGVDFINGYQLKFTVTGAYEINGNINCTIVPDLGVFVDRLKAAAFQTFASGSGVTSQDIADISDASATKTWAETVRTLTSGGSGGTTPQEIWEYATRDLTEPAGVTAQNIVDIVAGVWAAATRTLTSGGGGGGATPQEIWEYATRELTGASGGGSLTTEQATQLKELWQVEGLDINNPMTATKTTRIVDGILQIYTGDRRNTTTATRQ